MPHYFFHDRQILWLGPDEVGQSHLCYVTTAGDETVNADVEIQSYVLKTNHSRRESSNIGRTTDHGNKRPVPWVPSSPQHNWLKRPPKCVVTTLLITAHKLHVKELDRIQASVTIRLYSCATTVPSSDVGVTLETTSVIHDRVVTVGEHDIKQEDVGQICLFQFIVRESQNHRPGP